MKKMEKQCNCKGSTSSVNGKCVECGGDMTWKSEKARKDFDKYVEEEGKKKCNLCGGKRRHFMINCISAFFCTNTKCKKSKIPPGFFGPPATPSHSVTI